MENEKLKLAAKLIDDFKKYLDKRSGTFLTYNALPKLLTWHVEMWGKDMELLGKGSETLNLWSQYSQLLMQLDALFNDIETKVLQNNTMDVYTFFRNLEEHAEKFKNEKRIVKEKDERYYIEHLLEIFYRVFFDKIGDSPSSFQIWDSYFPESWKISASTLKDNPFQRITLGQFMMWAMGRIANAKEKDFDTALNDASEELFPEVDPRWSAILVLTLSSYDPNARIKSVIERPWTFGFGGRIRVLDGYRVDTPENVAKQEAQMRSMDEAEKARTIEMVKTLSNIVPVFHHTFSHSELTSLKAQAISLEYPADSTYERRRRQLLEIIEAILPVTA